MNEFDTVSNLLSYYYVQNINTQPFLLSCNYDIDLSKYNCYCVGLIDKKRVINLICISRIIQRKYRIHLEISINEGETFWVQDTITIRKHFLLYEDKTSFFRSTFLYNPKDKQIYRMQILLPYLKVPQVCWGPGVKIYTRIGQYHYLHLGNIQAVGIYYAFLTVSRKKKILKRKWKEFSYLLQSISQSSSLNVNLDLLKTTIEST